MRGDIIYKEIVKKYINLLTINDIKNFAIKNKYPISDSEASIIYDFIKNHYNEILDKDDKVFELIKNKIRPELYNIIINLYNENKIKYLS